ncbi:putative ABC transporter [Emiliania huxleyi CCMP1516]|uniref:ABC transmembrane type-1 domain-containing protein n=3 Tax=Emiliania huxleyi TaxID=2903 RepID=A0A0D3JRQ1_EMIH1|nr:putative ABC transporter [Emiliania huxleyi CCMP1516]EOD26186.1 putative ABC transporter [Emiliania huxleyi CCMP1516]|eukprot:XP_005778615.1 putative ABC transporter [Emiliania huxleyi CCMP1516]
MVVGLIAAWLLPAASLRPAASLLPAASLRPSSVAQRAWQPQTQCRSHTPVMREPEPLLSRIARLPRRVLHSITEGDRINRNAPPPPGERRVGVAFVMGYLWPERGVRTARLRVLASLALLVVAKVFIVRVPFMFKRAIDAVVDGAVPRSTSVGLMFAYGVSRAVYTFLQEGRYLLFTPVGQSALRRFTADAFAHVQSLDAMWLGGQSTGELSRVFARGMRGMNALLRLVVFNIGPTLLETALALWLLGRRYGGAFLAVSLATVSAFVGWSLLVVQRRVALLCAVNDTDNVLFTRLFNALLCNEAVRTNANEDFEVRRYDDSLALAERLAVADVKTVAALNVGQAVCFWGGLGCMMVLCAGCVSSGALTVGDAVAINGLLLQLQQPLASLGFTYQEIRQATADMRQLLALLRRLPRVRPPAGAPPLASAGTASRLRFDGVSFGPRLLMGARVAKRGLLAHQALRLHDPGRGRVTIDGDDIAAVSLSSLRQRVSLDTILFDDTAEYNIRYGNLSASDEQVASAAERVGLLTPGGGLTPPQGFATRCKAVLDEAFANVTVLTVAHRLRSVMDYDQILVMQQGRLVERGTHAALLCANGTYARLWQRQADGGGDGADAFWRDGIPDYCELVDSESIARLAMGDVEDALTLRALDSVDGRGQGRGGWLW